MNSMIVIAVLLALTGLAYQLGMIRSSKQVVRGSQGSLALQAHSRPHHHGALVAFWTIVPAALVYLLWSWLSPWIVQRLVLTTLPEHIHELTRLELDMVLQRIQHSANDFIASDSLAQWEVSAAEFYRQASQFNRNVSLALASVIAAAGLLLSYRRVNPQLRARNAIERIIHVVLFGCSAIAILTTLGIVLSMVGETLHFFTYIHPADFFFGTTWNPRFASVGDGAQGEFG